MTQNNHDDVTILSEDDNKKLLTDSAEVVYSYKEKFSNAALVSAVSLVSACIDFEDTDRSGEPNPGEPNPGEPNPGEPNPGEPNPGEPNPGEPNPGETDPDEPYKPWSITEKDAARFLIQAQFSATLEEIKHVREIGFEQWIDDQINMPISKTTTTWINTVYAYDNPDLSAYPEGQRYTRDIKHTAARDIFERAVWQQLITCPDTLRKRMTLALSEIYVIASYAFNCPYKSSCLASYWDMLDSHAFGNLRELLSDVPRHFFMAKFLDILGSKIASADGKRQPDENFARELMQLMTIGLVELNNDGTVKKGADGKHKETYTIEDVKELARVFTGYIPPGGYPITKDSNTRVRFTEPTEMKPADHDFGKKTILGKEIPASNVDLGNTAECENIMKEEMEQVLDILFAHDNVAPFISKQLIMRFTTSNPSASYVRRVADVFNGKGGGSKGKGDLAAVIKAILLDPENLKSEPNNKTTGKAREPMLMFCQWARTFTSRKSVSGNWDMHRISPPYELGQVPLGATTIFNFFRPGDAPNNKTFQDLGIVAPELYLVDTYSVQQYSNFMYKLVMYGVRETYSSNYELLPKMDELKIRFQSSSDEGVQYLNLVMCAGTMSLAAQTSIIKAVEEMKSSNPDDIDDVLSSRAALALWMTLISPACRVQK